MNKLKSCPFCGEAEELSEYLEEDWMSDKNVRCDNCGALGPPCSDWEKAQLAWNERHLTTAAPDSEKDAVLEGDVYHIEYIESDKIVLTRCQ